MALSDVVELVVSAVLAIGIATYLVQAGRSINAPWSRIADELEDDELEDDDQELEP